MSLDNKTKYDEIDLSKLIVDILNNKFKISLFVFVSIFIIFIYQFTLPPNKVSYKVQSEIRPISIFEEANYVLYNSYVNKKSSTNNINSSTYNIPLSHGFPTYMNIDKEILLDLFIEEITHEIDTEDSEQNSLFKEAIKKFEIAKKKDVAKFASSIKLNSYKDQTMFRTIEFRATNINQITNFVKFIEKNINKKIQASLEKTFRNQISTQKKLREYEINDTRYELEIKRKNYDNDINSYANLSQREKDLNTVNKLNSIKNLELKLSFLTKGSDLKRLENIILASPIKNTEKFIAAKLVIQEINIKGKNDGPPLLTKLIMAGLFGLILGIFYILISSSIKRNS